MAENNKRRHLTAEEKLRILEEAQQPGVQIAELCRRHGIGTSQFYTWREQARQAAKQALSQPAGPTDANGVATGTLTSTVAEGKTISATISGTAITQMVAVTVNAGPAMRIPGSRRARSKTGAVTGCGPNQTCFRLTRAAGEGGRLRPARGRPAGFGVDRRKRRRRFTISSGRPACA